MGCIIPGNNGFFKELASLVLQTEAIHWLEKYIPLGPEWILPLFDTADIENSYILGAVLDQQIDVSLFFRQDESLSVNPTLIFRENTVIYHRYCIK